MKLAIVVEIIVLCCVLTVFSIFTIDTVSVRKAELVEVLSVDVGNIVEDYFQGDIPTEDLKDTIESNISVSTSSKYSNIEVTIFHASAEHGIVDFLIEATYEQPNGRPRMFSFERVYIREKPEDPGAAIQYSFIRTIDAAHYKSAANVFLPEEKGGLKADSIWKTGTYESLLDEALLSPD